MKKKKVEKNMHEVLDEDLSKPEAKDLSETDKEVMHMMLDLFMIKSRLDKIRKEPSNDRDQN